MALMVIICEITRYRHDKKAVRRRLIPWDNFAVDELHEVHLLRRPHVRLDASLRRQGMIGRGEKKNGARGRKRSGSGGKMRDAEGEGEGVGESYPRRSSGLKETINVPRTQWRTNGPLSGPCEQRVSPQRLSLGLLSSPRERYVFAFVKVRRDRDPE